MGWAARHAVPPAWPARQVHLLPGPKPSRCDLVGILFGCDVVLKPQAPWCDLPLPLTLTLLLLSPTVVTRKSTPYDCRYASQKRFGQYALYTNTGMGRIWFRVGSLQEQQRGNQEGWHKGMERWQAGRWHSATAAGWGVVGLLRSLSSWRSEGE